MPSEDATTVEDREAPAADFKEEKATDAKVEDDKDDETEEASKEKEVDKKPAEPEELEADDAPHEASRPKVAQAAQLSDIDCTLDAIVGSNGSLLSSFSQQGFGHLLSASRVNVGAKAGRYLFEVKVLERQSREDMHLRVGFSTAKSSLFLGDGSPDNICFDSKIGSYMFPAAPSEGRPPPATKTTDGPRHPFNEKVIGVLLNLTGGDSSTAGTLSLFLDGKRASPARPIPKHLLESGAALYPTVTFRNVTLAVNTGQDGVLFQKLPFVCTTIGSIAEDDHEARSFQKDARSKCTIVVPVGIPDEGYFDFIDRFIQQRPEFTELSERMLHSWAQKSGLYSQNSRHGKGKGKGKSEGKSGGGRFSRQFQRQRHQDSGGSGPALDSKKCQRMLDFISQFSRRDLIIGDAKNNLLPEERLKVLKRFAAPRFSVQALVAVGEPLEDFKSWVHQTILADYENKKAGIARRSKLMEEKQKAFFERKQKREEHIAEQRNKKRKRSDAKEDDVQRPSKKAKTEEKEEKEVKDEDMDAAAVKQEEEEDLKKPETGPDVWFTTRNNRRENSGGNRAGSSQLRESAANFAIPGDDEGFAEVKFEWQPRAASAEHLANWVSDLQSRLVVKDLKPSDWFKEHNKAWIAAKQDMQKKQKEFTSKNKGAKKEADVTDIFQVEDIHSADNNGTPLYSLFEYEDWVLLSWRYDLHLLIHAIAHDTSAFDKPKIPESLLSTCFKTYFNIERSAKNLGCKSFEEVVELLKDSLKLVKSHGFGGKPGQTFVEPLLAIDNEEIAEFVKFTEDSRRDRVRRIDAGDESATLSFQRTSSAKSAASGRDGKGKGKRKAGAAALPAAKDEQHEEDEDEGPAKRGRKGKGHGKNGRSPAPRQEDQREGKGTRTRFQVRGPGGVRRSPWLKTKTIGAFADKQRVRIAAAPARSPRPPVRERLEKVERQPAREKFAERHAAAKNASKGARRDQAQSWDHGERRKGGGNLDSGQRQQHGQSYRGGKGYKGNNGSSEHRQGSEGGRPFNRQRHGGREATPPARPAQSSRPSQPARPWSNPPPLRSGMRSGEQSKDGGRRYGGGEARNAGGKGGNGGSKGGGGSYGRAAYSY